MKEKLFELKKIIDEIINEIDLKGCISCKHIVKEECEEPCIECMRSFKDLYEAE